MNEENDLTAVDGLAERAKQLFDESVESMDSQTRSHLNRARQTALEQLKPGQPTIVHWVPLTGLAAAAVAAVVFWTPNPKVGDFGIQAMASDMEMLLTDESWEMLEDLGFYSWIELEEETNELAETGNNVS